MKVTFVDLTPEHVKYIYDNMREMDKKELVNVDVHSAEDAGERIFGKCRIATCGMIDDEPVAMLGIKKEDAVIYAFLLATDKVQDAPISLHRQAKRFLKAIREIYPSHPILAIVIDGYEQSIKWLKRLGFKEAINTGGNTIMRLD